MVKVGMGWAMWEVVDDNMNLEKLDIIKKLLIYQDFKHFNKLSELDLGQAQLFSCPERIKCNTSLPIVFNEFTAQEVGCLT